MYPSEYTPAISHIGVPGKARYLAPCAVPDCSDGALRFSSLVPFHSASVLQMNRVNGCFDQRRPGIYRRLAGEESARMMPRTALISRDDQPALVKIVRMVFWVDGIRSGGW
jgi:hypothetical protein